MQRVGPMAALAGGPTAATLALGVLAPGSILDTRQRDGQLQKAVRIVITTVAMPGTFMASRCTSRKGPDKDPSRVKFHVKATDPVRRSSRGKIWSRGRNRAG